MRNHCSSIFGRSSPATRIATVMPTNDQQTLPMQNRALREYAARRGWTIAMQIREIGSGAVGRKAREHLIEAAADVRSM